MTRSEEQLRVSLRRTEVGRARLRKYVTTEQVTRAVVIRQEELTIERESIADAGSDGNIVGQGAFVEDVIEVVLHEEVPLVDKQLVAAERIRLGTRTVTEDTTVSGEVRREKIELDDPTGTHR